MTLGIILWATVPLHKQQRIHYVTRSLLCHAKSATGVISMIIDACYSLAVQVVHLNKQVFLLLQLLLTSGCTSDKRFCLAPPQTLSRKQIKTKLMFCKP